MQKFCIGIVIAALSLSLLGCDRIPGMKKPARRSIRPSGPVLARVNDWVLSVKDFDDEIAKIIDLNKGEKEIPVESFGILARTFISPYVETVDLGSPEGKQTYLNLLVNLELLAQEAESRGLDRKPEIAKNIRKTTVEILDLSLLNDILKDIKVTPLEVEDFYNKEYKTTLEKIEQRKVREIVVDSETKAKDILIEVLRGANFASLASSNSITESAKKGGDLGYLIYDANARFNKFWEAVLTLDKGQVSGIFKHPEKQEYYIIKVEDIKKGDVESLSKIYSQLEVLLTQKKSFEAIDNLISGIKSKSQIQINNNLLN